jgi:hypothetical protein
VQNGTCSNQSTLATRACLLDSDCIPGTHCFAITFGDAGGPTMGACR